MFPKRETQLAAILSLPSLAVLVFLGLLPIAFPFAADLDGRLMPVVKRVEVTEVQHSDEGLLVEVTFDKVRQCEFLGITWYDSFGKRVPVLFEPESRDAPQSRPVKERQHAGPWMLRGLMSLNGSVAITSHRCNPFWITYSRFYP